MNHYFVVCDREKSYVERLTEAVNERGLVPYPIEGITDADALKVFCSDHRVELLLIEEELADEQVRALPVRCIVRMGSIPGAKRQGTVFKYQPVTVLMEEALTALNEKRQEQEAAVEPLPARTRVLGAYSPVKTVCCSAFALALGLVLAKEQRVLYLNFRPLTGLHELLGPADAQDLSDLLYMQQQGYPAAQCLWAARDAYRGNGRMQLDCIQTVQNMDYILPAPSPEDLHCLPADSLPVLVRELKESGRYDTIVLEFGEETEAYFSLLALCNTVYMPVREDAFAQAQLAQYERLSGGRHAPVSDKTIRVCLPEYKQAADGRSLAEQLVWSELGDYVRGMLWGTGK